MDQHAHIPAVRRCGDANQRLRSPLQQPRVTAWWGERTRSDLVTGHGELPHDSVRLQASRSQRGRSVRSQRRGRLIPPRLRHSQTLGETELMRAVRRISAMRAVIGFAITSSGEIREVWVPLLLGMRQITSAICGRPSGSAGTTRGKEAPSWDARPRPSLGFLYACVLARRASSHAPAVCSRSRRPVNNGGPVTAVSRAMPRRRSPWMDRSPARSTSSTRAPRTNARSPGRVSSIVV